jgi:probable HAF family extracellular repeat protein
MFGTRNASAVLLTSLYLLGGPTPRAAADFLKYSVKNLGVPPGGTFSDGFGLNDRGQVAGYADSRAGFYDGTSFHDLSSFLPGGYSIATGINNAGQIVGDASTNAGQHGFLYSGATGYKDLGTLGGVNSVASGINDKGQIVGYSYTSPATFHAYLYQNGVMKDLGTLGGQISTASAINTSGAITGESATTAGERHAFLYVNQKMIDLGIPTVPAHATALNSGANALNDKGVVVGEYAYIDAKSNFVVRAFRYDGKHLLTWERSGESMSGRMGSTMAAISWVRRGCPTATMRTLSYSTTGTCSTSTA